MAKSKSSKRWLQEHFSDQYVKQARKAGLRARSAYKLTEIQERYQIIKPGMMVVDLGAAPGGWSEYAAQLVGPRGKVVALDLLPMRPINGVEFLQGDFTEALVRQRCTELLAGRLVDVVLSDMAPNLSGIELLDQARSLELIEKALELARLVLRPGGVLVTKVFHGVEFEGFLKRLRGEFGAVRVLKPEASRARSREVFLLAKNFILH